MSVSLSLKNICRRYIKDINSRNRNLRQFAERTAVNSPIQGTAADIIKLAMIHCDRAIEDNRLDAKMALSRQRSSHWSQFYSGTHRMSGDSESAEREVKLMLDNKSDRC